MVEAPTARPMAARILIVEDEADLAVTLAYNLKQAGYEARVAATGAQAFAALREAVPDLVLLDLMLPDVSGTEICRRIRSEARWRAIPIIMLTARGEEVDRVVGFELGADDYVVKPYSVRELLLRVAAVLRRARPSVRDELALVRFGRLAVDPEGYRAFVDDAEVTLTDLEFRLLRTLLERRGRVQTRERLLADVWDMSPDVATRTVDTHVKRLRHKLGPAGRYIETMRGVGYRMRAEPPDEGPEP